MNCAGFARRANMIIKCRADPLRRWKTAWPEMTKSKLKSGPESRQLGKKGRERRRMIVEAAKQRIIERGLDGLVLREIAEELSITHGNLQYYFQTRDELLIAIFDEEVQKYTTRIQEFVNSAATPEGKLAAIIDSSVEVIEGHETRLWRILFGMAQQLPHLAEVLQRENDYYESVVAAELEAIAPEINKARLGHIAKMIRAIIDGMAIELIYQDARSPQFAALKGEVKTMFSMLLNLRR